MPANTPVMTVIYAKDLDRVSRFYEQTLSIPVLERDNGFVLLGNDAFEVSIVRMPQNIAAMVALSDPPVVRHDTAIKCSFMVNDLQQVAIHAKATGGDVKDPASAWRWRGQLHLDGHDPEGTVVQFRAVDAQP